MRKTHLLAVLLLLVFAASARADVVYSFSFTATSGPIESFAFSFTVPTLVTEGQTTLGGDFPSFNGFVATDGTNYWGLDFLAIGPGCFHFTGHVFGGNLPFCSPAAEDPHSAEVVFFPDGGLPTANGVYALGMYSDFITLAEVDEFANGHAQLTITPEPIPVVLLLTVLLAAAFVARRHSP